MTCACPYCARGQHMFCVADVMAARKAAPPALVPTTPQRAALADRLAQIRERQARFVERYGGGTR